MTVPYAFDSLDPRVPTEEQWASMSSEVRAAVVEQLPSEFAVRESHPPEGDGHRMPKEKAMGALDAFFRRIGRRVYLSAELPVYYPGERLFGPDLLAVLDVKTAERKTWVVAQEQKGLDFVLDVTLGGDRNKDLVENVELYARLGIPEYFVLALKF